MSKPSYNDIVDAKLQDGLFGTDILRNAIDDLDLSDNTKGQLKLTLYKVVTEIQQCRELNKEHGYR